jgi:hypothetical protein
MKFNVIVEGFIHGVSAAVEAATRGAEKNFSGADKINIKSCVDEIEASAFGGLMSVKTTFSDLVVDSLGYKFEEEGIATVNAKDLMTVLNSFAIDEEVIFELKDGSKDGKATKELSITMASDTDQFQTLPCYDNSVNLPAKSDAFSKTLELNRELLLYGLEKVAFAIGFEGTKQTYLYASLRTAEDNIKFAAGTGTRHIVLDISGKDVVKSTPKESSVLLHKSHIAVFSKILHALKSQTVTIKESKDATSSAFQVVIECSPHEIILIGSDPTIKWIDENVILDMDYTTKMVTRIDDWAYAAKGTTATFNDQVKKERRAHKAVIDVDVAKKEIDIKTNEMMRSNRKVPVVELDTKESTLPSFNCVSSYLREIPTVGEEGSYVQMEMIGPKKPVVFHYHANKNVAERDTIEKKDTATGLTEKMAIFFATYSA